MDIRPLLPSSIIAKAYEFNSEYAWKPHDVPELVSVLKEEQIAVLGGEVWEKADHGPVISSDIYQWSSRQKNDNESWEKYVNRTLGELVEFTEELQSEKVSDKDIYINITMLDVVEAKEIIGSATVNKKC